MILKKHINNTNKKSESKFMYKDIDVDYNSKFLKEIIYPLIGVVFLLNIVGLLFFFTN